MYRPVLRDGLHRRSLTKPLPWVLDAFRFLVDDYGFAEPTARQVVYETVHDYQGEDKTVSVTSDGSTIWHAIHAGGRTFFPHSIGYGGVLDEYTRRFEPLEANARFLRDHPELIAADSEFLIELADFEMASRHRWQDTLRRAGWIPRDDARARAGRAIHYTNSDLAEGRITRREWARQIGEALADAYLAIDDPRWQSGFDGSERRWREGRELILECVDRDGTFLDVGCANGYLMESLARWNAERPRPRRLELHGVDVNERLARRARERMPEAKDRIHVGDVLEWKPPRRFTYVRTGLEYVPAASATTLIQRLRRDFLEPGGTFIIGPFESLELTEADVRTAGITEWDVHSVTDSHYRTRHVLCVAG